MESDSNEEYINDEEYNSRIAKTSKVSCLNCRTYHKKCIGGRPCDYCKSKNIECLENHKRKATGRPKKKGEEKTEPKKDKKKVVQEIPKKIKTKVGEDIAKIGQNNDPQSQIVRMEPNNHQINPTHIQINALMSANQKICDKCNSTQEMSAKFCNKCGNRLPELIILQNDNLLKEIEFLRKKNMELNNFIQMRMFSPTNMWMLTKLAVPSPKFTYPLASYILESSPAFLNLLGYKDLTNVFYPDMFPQEHHKMLSSKNFFIKVERMEGMLVPKYSFKDDVYMRHSSGTFIHLLLNATMYFDNITRLPSMRVVHVEKVFQLNVKKEELPLHNPPTDSTYYCGLDDEIPEIIKKFNPNYGAPTFNNIIKRDVFLNVPPENTVNPSNIFGTIDIPNFDPNTLSFGGGFNNNQSNYF